MSVSRHRRAFTLIELILTLVIGSIVLIAMFYGVVYFFGQISGAQEDVQLRRDAEVASRWIELSVREGTWAYLQTDAADSLTAENYQNGTLQWQKDVYRNGTKLMVDQANSSEQVLPNLDSLTFDVHSDRVAYALSVAEGGETYSLSSAVRLRNARHSGIWHFSRTTGRVAYDDSSKRNHALMHACRHVTPADSDWEYGPVVAFDGPTAGSYLEVPDNPGLDTVEELSVSAWVKLSTSAANDMTSSGTKTLSIMNRNGESTGPGGFFHVYMEAGELCFGFRDESGSVERAFSGGETWEAGRWYEVLVQYREGKDDQWVRFYRDGKLIGTATVNNMHQVTAGDLLIGAWDNAGTPDGMWEGHIDEVRFCTF
ncbi:MAG: LamG-like jellyroll fold domain-containing protein [Planctomycetota bacterium]